MADTTPTAAHPLSAEDLDKLREAFDAEAPNYQINVERFKNRPDEYKFEFATNMWKFVQAMAGRAQARAALTGQATAGQQVGDAAGDDTLNAYRIQHARLVAENEALRAKLASARQFSLPNGWNIDRGGDDLRIRAKDGMWCGYRADDENPARRLMHKFLSDLHRALNNTTGA